MKYLVNQYTIIMIYYVEVEVKVWVAQSWATLCDPMDCSPPGSSVHGILQPRILEWVAIPFSRRSSQPRDWTLILQVYIFTVWASREAPNHDNKIGLDPEAMETNEGLET